MNNIVFMGMGEPLHNLEEVLKAIVILEDPYSLGYGARKITVSTAGFVPGIDALAHSEVDVQLAVSLNAVRDDLRSKLMPINRTYPLHELMSSLRRFPLRPRRKITIEYVMIDGVNDTDQDLKELVDLVRDLRVKLNLIPCNPCKGAGFKSSSSEQMERWRQNLRQHGIQANIRRSKGVQIEGACGQLVLN